MKKWMKWVIALAATVVVFIIGNTAVHELAPSHTVGAPSGRIVVPFWHAINGPNGKTLEAMVARFNKSQKKYWVESVYEGSYSLTQSKYINTLHSNVSPALIQIDQGNGATTLGINNYVPAQEFIDKDGYDLSQIYTNVLNAYTIKGQLLSIPFNSSAAVLYYNQDLFKKYKVPLLPQSPTYSQIANAAKLLTQRSGDNVKGFTMQIYDWLADELVANQGGELVNNGNGRTAVATKANVNTPEMRRVFTWVQGMIKDGSFQNYGTGSGASANQMAGFVSGKLGMFMQSSAAMGTIAKSAKFKFGVTFMPHPDGVPANGVAIGGASFWITKDKPAAVRQGAWEFAKFAISPKEQAAWQAATGYIAVNKNALKEPVLKKAITKNPGLLVPVAQLQAAKNNAATAGPFYANLNQAAQFITVAMQQIYAGGDINKALSTAQQKTDQAIQATNAVDYDLLKFDHIGQ